MGAASQVSPETFRLHCEKCGRGLDDVAGEPMQLVLLFKPSRVHAVIPKTHPREHRRRCRPCGYVNVFHPIALTDSWRDNIVVK